MPAPYIVGDSSPFLKRVLIPFWIIRIIIMVIQIGLYALIVAGLGVFKDDIERLYDEYNTSLNYDAVLAVSCIIMVIILVCLILDIVCIIKRARRTLSPPFFFGVTLAQSVFYVVNFILTYIGARNGAIAIVISIVILLSFLGLLIYSSIIFHKYRKGTLRGAYEPANNPESHKLVANTGYTGSQTAFPPQSYAQDYPKTAYYDQHAALQTQAYAGQGYPSQPYAPQQQHYHPQQQQHQPQQQGYELNQRSAV